MKRLLKFLALVVALPVTLAAILIMALQGCKQNEGVVCDPVHAPTQPATTDPGTDPATAPASQPPTPRP